MSFNRHDVWKYVLPSVFLLNVLYAIARHCKINKLHGIEHRIINL